jgi:shikimate kinase
MNNTKNNITLIGMAGVGKSYIGEHVAKKLGYDCVEVDDLITVAAKKIGVNENVLSDEKFVDLEESVVLGLKGMTGCVFVTGGSVIYSKKAMDFLKANSQLIYLEDLPGNIKERLDLRDKSDPSEIKGKIVGLGKKTFDELLEERKKLYEKYADVTINVSEYINPGDLADEIASTHSCG